MNIVFYRHSLLGRGGDKMVVTYANHLTQQGHDVTIMANVVDTVFTVQAKTRAISKNKSKLATILNALTRTMDADVVLVDIIALAMLFSVRNRKRTIYFAQDYNETYYESFPAKIFIRLLYFYCLTVLKIPVIAVSDELGQLLQTRFHARVTVVQNGIDPEVYFPDRDKDYQILKNNRKVILVFAQGDYRKGFDIVINVLSRFADGLAKNEITIWAVGERIKTPFSMTHFGFVAPERLRKILSCSDVLFYPSRSEGFGLFVLEALACRCPVVTTEAIRFLRDGVDAVVCKSEDTECLANALVRILEDRSFCEKIVERGLLTAMRYNLQESKRIFQQSLEQFCNAK